MKSTFSLIIQQIATVILNAGDTAVKMTGKIPIHMEPKF